jgi:hypothetical protein
MKDGFRTVKESLNLEERNHPREPVLDTGPATDRRDHPVAGKRCMSLTNNKL